MRFAHTHQVLMIFVDEMLLQRADERVPSLASCIAPLNKHTYPQKLRRSFPSCWPDNSHFDLQFTSHLYLVGCNLLDDHTTQRYDKIAYWGHTVLEILPIQYKPYCYASALHESF